MYFLCRSCTSSASCIISALRLDFFFNNFLVFLVNQPTAVLNCTILEGCIALHCTDMWQVIGWHVKCHPLPFVCLYVQPFVHTSLHPSVRLLHQKKVLFWHWSRDLESPVCGNFCIDNISRFILAWPSEIQI